MTWIAGYIPTRGDYAETYDLPLETGRASLDVSGVKASFDDTGSGRRCVALEAKTPRGFGGQCGWYWYWHKADPGLWKRYRLYRPDGEPESDLHARFRLRLNFAQCYTKDGYAYPAPEGSAMPDYSRIRDEAHDDGTWIRLATPTMIRGDAPPSLYSEFDFYNTRKHDRTPSPYTTFEGDVLWEYKIYQLPFLGERQFDINLSQSARRAFPRMADEKPEQWAIVAWYPVFEWMGSVRGSFEFSDVEFYTSEDRSPDTEEIVEKLGAVKVTWLDENLMPLPPGAVATVGETTVIKRTKGPIILRFDCERAGMVNAFWWNSQFRCAVTQFDLYVRADDGETLSNVDGRWAKVAYGPNYSQWIERAIGPLRLQEGMAALLVLKTWQWSDGPAWLTVKDVGFSWSDVSTGLVAARG